ncbi:hypothetical protein [Collimonas arenae]|nr:hypothetical protein [Collimonas arenae]
MNSPDSNTARIQLGHDRSNMFYASRGTAIVSLQGNILIAEAASHLVDITVANRALIAEGDCHVIQRGGWVRLCAQGGGKATGLIILPTRNFLGSLLARWLRRGNTSTHPANRTEAIES